MQRSWTWFFIVNAGKIDLPLFNPSKTCAVNVKMDGFVLSETRLKMLVLSFSC